MPTPNFLIIGPPKCATTALYAVLRRHPQVYMSPVKEPFFFAFDGRPPDFYGSGTDHYRRFAITDWNAYLELFAAATGQIAVGEASPLYLTSYQPERTAENIRRRLPDMRLVAVLRQPAERAYSHFTSWRQQGYEPLADFRQALAEEGPRAATNWPPGCRYRQNGRYFSNLTPYYERFPRDQIRVYLYDDLNTQPQPVLADLCRFLGVDQRLIAPALEHRNVTTWTRSAVLQRILRRPPALKAILPRSWRRLLRARLKAWNQVKPPPLDRALRRELTESYRDEILRLQDLIERDLSHWLVER